MKYVLFVCTENAGRSQMAQAFSERYAPADIRAESAGLEPAAQINPTVVEAMQEIGMDISDRRPKKLTVEMQLHADLAVTLGCGGHCPYVPTRIEDWDLPDSAGRPIEEVRAIRDEIGGRVDDLCCIAPRRSAPIGPPTSCACKKCCRDSSPSSRRCAPQGRFANAPTPC